MKTKIDYSRFNLLNAILFIWQILQVIGALLCLIVIRTKPVKYTNEGTGMTVWRVHHNFRSCWSMGPFIFVPNYQPDYLMRHETGHSIQSIFLGPLFLIVVGIPSAILLAVRVTQNKDKKWYHSHYPENWADKLGAVELPKDITK
jgi:hypothetical protein